MPWVAKRLSASLLPLPAAEKNPDHRIQLYVLSVLRDVHGSGTGQSLLEAALGQEAVHLRLTREYPRAHSFHRRNGCLPDGTENIDDHANDLLEVRLIR